MALAIFVGVLYVSPELLIWKKLNDLGKPYVAIQLTHHGDEALGTISRFREIYDGHFLTGELYLDKNAPPVFGPIQIMSWLMAGFIFLFKGNINASYLFATFVLPPVIFLLFYWLGKVISSSRLFSVFFALLAVLTPISRALPRSFESVSLFLNNIGKYFIPLVSTPLAKLPLGRTEDPMLTFLLFVPTIAVLLLFWRKPNYKTGALLGALIGLMFNVYFHYWVFLVIVLGLIGLYSLFKFRQDKNLFKSLLVVFGILIVVTIPYWINFFNFQSLSNAQEISWRVGTDKGRTLGFLEGSPSWFDYIFYVLLAGIVYRVFFKRNQKNTAILYWLLIGAMFLAWNVQVVTGFVPASDHWARPISLFILVILFHAVYELLRKVNYKIVAVCLIIGSVLLVSKKVVNALIFVNPPQKFIDEKSFESRAFNPSIVESWDWINKNLPHEPKIISPSFITSIYSLSQTSARPYFISGFNTAATNQLIEERFLNTYKLFKVPPEFLRRVLEIDYSKDFRSPEKYPDSPYPDQHTYLNTVETITYLYFGYYYGYPGRERSETTYRFVTKEKADQLIADYSRLFLNWKDIEAGYVYYGPWEKQITKIDLSKDPDLEPLFKNEEVEIYKILRPMK